jgi:hypothetical protein
LKQDLINNQKLTLMKTKIFLMLMLSSCIAFGQSKKEMEQAQKEALAKIDTLKKSNAALASANKNLTTASDSLAKELEKYFGLYTVIKNKVVKKDFDPAKMATIIDSLKAGRDSLTLKAASAALNADAGKKQMAQIDSLRKETEGLLFTVNLLRGKPAKSPQDVKQFIGTWSLVLRKVKVTGQAPRSGIVDISDEPVAKTASPLEVNPITQVTFIDAEFAEFTFKNGEKGKGYYVIDNFSPTKSYFIDFKGTKADFRMYFMNTLVGPRISFEVPGSTGVYYFGQMTQ